MRRAVIRLTLPGIVTVALFSGGAVAYGSAGSVSFCVPSKPHMAVTSTSSGGTCATGSAAVTLPASSSQQHTLLSILPDISFQASGVGGKPTVQFAGVNLQLVNGSGSETVLNGKGNLVIGYDPKPLGQSGSHNLVLGTSGQGYSSYGGIDAGFQNVISAPAASVLGGLNNTADGLDAAITGGEANSATGRDAWVGGGIGNRATNADSTVSGGGGNDASGASASILGGFDNVASGNGGSVAGGTDNTASGGNSSANSVTGGTGNVGGGVDSEAGGSPRNPLPLNASNWSGNACCGAGAPQWYTDGSGIVHLEGAVTQTSSSGQANLIGTLPDNARPTRTVFTIVHTDLGTYADLAIGTDGTITLLPSFNTNTGFVSLEGITFRQ